MADLKRTYQLRRNDLLYPELCFKINGILFKVFKTLGGGHRESYYQKAIKIGLEKENIKFKEQYYVPVVFEGKTIGKYFLDFLIEDKIILEVKRGQFVMADSIKQTKEYLIALKLSLALIANFTYSGVYIKRIINQTHY